MCQQDCGHGICVAPNTCQCPPDWSGFDCSQPVCHQGYFEPVPSNENIPPHHWLEYKPCNMSTWCTATGSFECNQKALKMYPTIPLSGSQWR